MFLDALSAIVLLAPLFALLFVILVVLHFPTSLHLFVPFLMTSSRPSHCAAWRGVIGGGGGEGGGCDGGHVAQLTLQ